MSLRKSAIFKGILSPIQIKFEACQVQDGVWQMKYTEWFDPTDKATLQEAAATTKKVLQQIGYQHKQRGNRFTIIREGPLEMVFASIIGELLLISKLGQVTLADLLVLAGTTKLIKEEMKK